MMPQRRTAPPVAAGAIAAVLLLTACSDSVTNLPPPTPGPVQGLMATVQGGVVRLSWAVPPERDVNGSLVVRFPAAGVDALPEGGRSYQEGDPVGSGMVVFSGPATEIADSPPCPEHVYGVWARNSAGVLSLVPQTVRVTGLPESPPPPPPTAISAVVEGASVRLSWTGPTGAPGSVVRIVRRRDSPPIHPQDGDVVFAGSSTQTLDAVPEMSPLVTWYYTAYSCTPCGTCGAEGSPVQVTPTLMESLAVGGFVIFWRHATANTCADQTELGTAVATTTPDWWRSCDRACPPEGGATARQLNPEGYEEAAAIGAALRARAIPFGRVFSSEFCRCTETAERMGLSETVETLPEITYFVYPERSRCTAVDALLSARPHFGTNTAIVGHVTLGPGVSCPILADLLSGEAAIYRPDGSGGYSFVGRVKAHEWPTLP